MNNNRNDEIKHYGVIGMKWGTRRGHSDAVLKKAQKKMIKLDKKAVKAEDKRLKASSPLIRTSISDAKHIKAIRISDKRIRKARKWYEKVEKTIGSESASKLVNLDGTKSGERYAKKYGKIALHRNS